MKQLGTLYLIPHVVDAAAPDSFIPAFTKEKVQHIRHFIMESEKAGRALIKRLGIPQTEINVQLWNEHSNEKEKNDLLKPLLNGLDMGLMSDAGTPCIADPGYDVVMAAHKQNIKVVPLAGSSSIMLALMASGLGGQKFSFHGYLPIEKPARIKMLKDLETQAQKTGYTQIFMEAPYRNNHLFDDILANAKSETRLTIAAEISSENELILTKTIAQWKQFAKPDLHKKPCVFLMK